MFRNTSKRKLKAISDGLSVHMSNAKLMNTAYTMAGTKVFSV